MINYETANSPHFVANKLFCEQLAATFQGDWSGFCNSYGYEIETKYTENNLNYKIKLQKSQTTQNGVVVPIDARDTIQIDVEINGFLKEAAFEISKSWLKSVFTSNDLKEQLPKNYSANINFELSNEDFTQISNFVQTYGIEKLVLANGKLNFQSNSAIEDLDKFKSSLLGITDFLKTIAS